MSNEHEPSESSSSSDYGLDQLLERQFDRTSPYPSSNSRANLHFPTPSNLDLLTSGPLVSNSLRIQTEEGFEDDAKDRAPFSRYRVSCICSSNHSEGVLLNCFNCSTFQHGICVGELNQAADYICHNCRIHRKSYKFYDGWNSYWAQQLKAEFEEKMKGRFDSFNLNIWLEAFKRENNMRSINMKNLKERFMEIIAKYLREDVYSFNQKLKFAFFSKADVRMYPELIQHMGVAGRCQLDEKNGNVIYFSYFDGNKPALGKMKNPPRGNKNNSGGAPDGRMNETSRNRKRTYPTQDSDQLLCSIKHEHRGNAAEKSEKLYIPNNSVYYFLFLFWKLLSEQKCNDPLFTQHVEEFRKALLTNQLRLQKIPLKIEEWYILFQRIVDNTINAISHVDEDVQIVSETDIFICPKIFLEEVKKMISSFCEHSDQIKMLMERIENEIAEFKGTERMHSSPIDRTFFEILQKYLNI